MTLESLIKQLINNLTTVKEISDYEAKKNEESNNTKAKNIDKIKGELAITLGEVEETAITMADFLAEYYLSQLGIDDFNMEGGEGE